MMMYGKLCTQFYDADKKFASQEEVNFYQSIFNKNDLILEPMCGSGRLLIPLLQSGYTVHGVDNSAEMLASCRQRASELNLQPILFEQDVKEMKLEQIYDGIIIPLGSFQLFYPRSNAFHALQVFKKYLKPNGKLILDLFIPWDALYENNEHEESEREITINDKSIIKISSHSKANKYEQYILSNIKYSEWIDGALVRQEDEEMYISWYYRHEMELILEKFGFKIAFYKERFLNNSNHMTFVAINLSGNEIKAKPIDFDQLKLTVATLNEYPLIQNMGRFYVYDMSEYLGNEEGWEIPEDGLYECIDFKKYWNDKNSFPFLVRYKNEIAGFAIIDKKGSNPAIDFNMAQFFILRKFKNKGIGQYVAQKCFNKFRGTWEVMVMPGNDGAYQFWESTIKNYTNNNFITYTAEVPHLGNSCKNIFKFDSKADD